jgi:hypothetical protein
MSDITKLGSEHGLLTPHAIISTVCSSDASDYEGGSERVRPSERDTNERTSLLPPSGISSNEHLDVHKSYAGDSHDHQRRQQHSQSRSSRTQGGRSEYQESGRKTLRMDNTTGAAVLGHQVRSLEMPWTFYLFRPFLTISFYLLKA